MKKRRGKRLVAYIIAFAMIFSMGMTELSPIAEAAQYTILETDVSAPSTGCTMFGVYGTYYVDAQNALNRINEIRKEACEAGNVPDPRNSNRMLTASDYVVIPITADRYGFQGLFELNASIKDAQELNEKLKIAGILLVRYNNRTILAREVRDTLISEAHNIGTELFRTSIRECILLILGLTVISTLLKYDKSCTASKDYIALVDELLKEIM